MLSAIDFDDQSCLVAYQIGTVDCDPVLAAELVSVELPISNMPPQSRFGIRLAAAQVAFTRMVLLASHPCFL